MESFTETYENLNNNPEYVEAYANIKSLSSLRPIITESNEDVILESLKQRKVEYLKTHNLNASINQYAITDEDIYEDLDDLEEIVGDDVYASMLNGNAEIQVGNKIFKYTDVGLFVTEVDDYDKLKNYLEIKQISPNIMIPTPLVCKRKFCF